MAIHPTAVIDPKAELDSSVEVGAYAVVGPDVRIGAGSKIGHHVVVEGLTTIGEQNTFFPFCSVGQAPQDKKYAGEPTRLEIGNGNTFRECVTLNTGTVQDVGVTRLGDDNWVMAYAHVAHDCQVGNNVVIANTVLLAGHVQVGDNCFLGGDAAVHQFVRIGAGAIVSGGSRIAQDVPPNAMAAERNEVIGFNLVGLKRRGVPRESIRELKDAFRVVYFTPGNIREVAVQALGGGRFQSAEARDFLEFFASGKRGFSRARRESVADEDGSGI